MTIERRKFNRIPVHISASLSLCRKKTGERISAPVKCMIFDISKSGAGVFLSRVIVDTHHLFFDALESDEFTLSLGIQTPLYARPVWFNRILDETDNPFKMGLQFFEKLSAEEIQALKKLSD